MTKANDWAALRYVAYLTGPMPEADLIALAVLELEQTAPTIH